MRNSYTISNIEKILPSYSDYLTQTWEKHGKGVFLMKFTNAGPPRAFASRLEDHENISVYSITIAKDLLYILYEYLKIFLSDNNLFPDVGVSKKLLTVSSIREKDFKELDFQISNNSIIEFDRQRETLHGFLYRIILKFLTNHEFAHLINGHVDLLKEYSSTGVKLSSLDKQTLEFDADVCSAQWVFNEYLHISESLNGSHPVLHSKNSTMYCLLFCHLLMMSISSYYFITIDNLKSSDHPSPYLRNYISTLAIFDILKSDSANSLDYDNSHITDFFAAYDRVIEEKNHDELEWTFKPGSAALEHQEEIQKNWNVIRLKLKKHAMVGLAGPYNP